MAISVNEASAVLRAAVRQNLERGSLRVMLQGCALMFAGLLALIFPIFASEGLLVILGWILVLSALVQAVSLIGATQVPYFWLDLTAVVLGLLVGWLLISRPEAGLTAITFLMLVFFMVSGIEKIVFALMIRPMKDWLLVLASGIVALLMALVLFANLAEVSHWLIAVLLGIQLLAVGGAQALMGWRMRNAARAPASTS